MECDNYVVIYVNCFKSRLDTFWQNQDIVYFRAEIEGTGNRTEVWLVIVFDNLARRSIEEMGIEVLGRFVPMHFRSRERNDHICGRFVPGNDTAHSNICSHELSYPTTVATRYSMHHYELFNYDYRVRLK